MNDTMQQQQQRQQKTGKTKTTKEIVEADKTKETTVATKETERTNKSNEELERISCQIERVTYYNDENDYAVLRVAMRGQKDLVTVVGNIASPAPGSLLSVTGKWSHHGQFGKQFRAIYYTCSAPSNVVGIEKYLGSGLIKGIGPKMARRIVAAFGEETLDVIERSVHRLSQVSGIGKHRIQLIANAWNEQKEIRNVMMFLQSHGVSSTYATKIYKHYGDKAISIVQDNPYLLAYDIWGIGFLTADKIARSLGFSENSPKRAAAALMFTLHEAADRGDIFCEREQLINNTNQLVHIDHEILQGAITELAAEERVVVETLSWRAQTLIDEAKVEKKTDKEAIQAIYLTGYHLAETRIAQILRELKHANKALQITGSCAACYTGSGVINDIGKHLDNGDDGNDGDTGGDAASDAKSAIDNIKKPANGSKGAPNAITNDHAQNVIDAAINWAQGKLQLQLATQQVAAVQSAIRNKITIITGGPGTGKTTITRAIIEIAAKNTRKIMLAAPTGRAAKRMSEATGWEAKTIHRLLECGSPGGGFKHNQDCPLDCELLIIDEVSMVDNLLAYHLLKAVPKNATLILIGDINQLPSVGAGNVLKDLIASAAFPVIELNEIFRQAQTSQIIVNAHKIIHGEFPQCHNRAGTDFYFLSESDPELMLKKLIAVVKARVPQRFGFDAKHDIQVLTPMNRGVVGTTNLNEALQEALNPANGTAEVARAGRKFRVGDKVMQIKNNYDKGVYNGDIGLITGIDPEQQEVVVAIDERKVAYDYDELDELVLAYAVSIHKSQGSEYPVVVIPLAMAHYVMLQRNLIYTGITRGRRLVIVIGSKKAMHCAVRNNQVAERCTWLARRCADIKHTTA